MQDIYSVSGLTEFARSTLESQLGRVWVQGEISNLARPASGHVYFTLKDSTAQVRCAMFRNRSRGLHCRPENGLEVLAFGLVSLYPARGDFQLIVDSLEVAGDGLLALKFEQLKRKLDAEGLFDTDLKRELPAWPRCIGVVTSASGAALRDILNVLRRRCPAVPVILYPTLVQGEGAAAAIVRMLEIANAREECDVLILARGGGSMEDLWPFNEERVARAIFDSALPLVSGVGHEVDVTIADLVADVRAPTPSAAAELVSPDNASALERVGEFRRRLAAQMGFRLKSERAAVTSLGHRLISPRRRIEMGHQRIDELSQRLAQAVDVNLRLQRTRLSSAAARARNAAPRERLQRLRSSLDHLEQRLQAVMTERIRALRASLAQRSGLLHALGPGATLDRGYAIVMDQHQRVVRDADTLKKGETVSTRLARGRFTASVLDADDDSADQR